MQKFLDLSKQFEGSDFVIDEADLKFDKKLGDGASGTTFLGHFNGQKVAIKVYSAAILKNDFNSVKNELQIMSKMRHKNIVHFKGLYIRKDPPGAALVTSFAERGELGHALYSSRLVRRKGDALRFKIVLGLAEGLKYLHSNDVIHRDIKPANILLDDDNEPMLTDFGFSRFIDHDQNRQMTGETGSYRYMAPEVTSHSRYTEKADTYSFALICNEIFMDERPFEYQISLVVARDVVKKNLRPSQKKIKNDRLKTIIARCWDPNPELRPEWDEVISELKAAQIEIQTRKSKSAISSLFKKKAGSASSSSSGHML
ncbi:Serine/threonine-protein kinase STY8 [Gracilariopsis chorda]|uniref:Serine/threonine-protein kinase STY8 n=1 Tax=Gracilariopsis chorda TaxID=448386 RepID=A0A2V3J3J2_9FLOR|nr:Serine/threonine-protein kinase STY8 [Gracilariopsis chorda]|eukprot:PXF47950.1 Serine/threonine-protein kinase STY8 [Gracilariopsis chorda]